jgi:HD superfamily phosphohydrolase
MLYKNTLQNALQNTPKIRNLIEVIDNFFEENYPDFTNGSTAPHPIAIPKDSKIIRDVIWGINRFEWFEMAVIDSPILQRLRYLHQIGFGTYVYPGGGHTRFDHSMGASIVASKIFDNLLSRQRETFELIVRAVNNSIGKKERVEQESMIQKSIAELRQEVRLAALLHDSGHTLFSHTSEPVLSEIKLLTEARDELAFLSGKTREPGEVLSFCISQSKFLKSLLKRYKERIAENPRLHYTGFLADLENVSLMIIGRTKDPFTQFLADIISSGFDADKLDYLMRDGRSTGLPVGYDIERYLQFVEVKQSSEPLIESGSETYIKWLDYQRRIKGNQLEEYRLNIPLTSMEEIIIGKFMLFSYIYHQSKIRSVDSYLEWILKEEIRQLKSKNEKDEDIVKWLLGTTDSVFMALPTLSKLFSRNKYYSQNLINCAYRISTRTLPREVFAISGSAGTHANASMIKDFMKKLKNQDEKKRTLKKIEDKLNNALKGKDVKFWIDAPKFPGFEGITDITGGANLADVFPIKDWMELYLEYTYRFRIFTFSEYIEDVKEAVGEVMPAILKVSREEVDNLLRKRVN